MLKWVAVSVALLLAVGCAKDNLPANPIIGSSRDTVTYEMRLRIDTVVSTVPCIQFYCASVACATGMLTGEIRVSPHAVELANEETRAVVAVINSMHFTGVFSRSMAGTGRSFTLSLQLTGGYADMNLTGTIGDTALTGTWSQFTDPHYGSRRGQFTATLAGHNPPPAIDSRADSVVSASITPRLPPAVRVGGTAQLTGNALNRCASPIAGQQFTWSSSNPAKATVVDGSVTGLSDGTVTITGTVIGKQVSATKTVYVLGSDTLAGGAIVGGDRTACAITTPGRTYCWGPVLSATADTGAYAFPIPVASGFAFTTLAVTSARSCGLDVTGKAYCWGYNTSGELGDGSTTFRPSPVPVATNAAFATLSVQWGPENFTCGVTTDHIAQCWGGNYYGELGDGTTTLRSTPVSVAGSLSFATIATGYYSTCGITTAGAAYCWGRNNAGQVGDGSTVDRHAPTPVSGGLVFHEIVAAGSEACALAADSTAYCWGGGSTVPSAVPGGLHFKSITTAFDHRCGLTASGAAYCWGSNASGALGDGTTTDRAAPVPVVGGWTFTDIVAASYHTCARTVTGRILCWGDGHLGMLGNLSTSSSSVPVGVAPAPTP